ncbi:hypothetical protein SB384_10425 [Burkholderia cenocepacia]|uniref:beta strand repeat-containing protein n=1 Tax=Burkholderia cenocepacia TaxID=95486 RepID=UPI002B24CF59|nr:hypothetical protein [Burkholderia cenocepacia]MEB2600062.1 hypothetical protein [Burkholderia cenocepacia]
MSTLTLTIQTPPSNRNELAQALGQNESAVRRFEAMTKDITVNIPDFVNGVNELVLLLQQVAYIIASPNANVPNAEVLTAGAGISLTLGSGTATIALSIPVSVPNGGTGVTSLTKNGVLIGEGTAAPNFAVPGTPGYVLMSNGVGADPSFQATVTEILAGTGINVSAATGNVTVSLQTPVSVSNGGTGTASMTANGVLIGNGTSAPNFATGSSAGQVLTWNSSGAPTFQALPTTVTQILAGTGINVSSSTGNVTVSLQTPVAVANGGTGAGAPSGTALDNITGFSGTGLLRRTGAGAYTFDAPSTYLQAANNLSDIGSASTARSNLGLGTMATQSAASVSITGGSANGLTLGATTPEPATVTSATINPTGSALPTPLSNTLLQMGIVGGGNSRMLVEAAANNGNLTFRRCDGTFGAPSAIAANEIIGTIVGFGYGATGYSGGNRVSVGLVANENWTDTAQGTRVDIGATPTGTTAPVTALSVAGSSVSVNVPLILSQTTLLQTSVSLTNGAGSSAGTLNNAPAAGNPTKWVPFNDNGTIRYIPAW